MYERNTQACILTLRCRGKAESTTYSNYLSVIFFIRYVKGTRRIILCYAACPALPNVSKLSHKRQEFPKKNIIEHKICILIFFYKFFFLKHLSF